MSNLINDFKKNKLTRLSNSYNKTIFILNNNYNVEIRNINKQLVFGCKGDFCNQETIISDNDNGVQNITSKVTDEIVQGFFHLRYLVMFTKCTNLCTTVEMYLKNDYPLIVKYSVASLGDLKLCLAPSNNEIM